MTKKTEAHDITESYAKRYPRLVGIRGWLVVFLVGIFLSVFANFYSAFSSLADKTTYTGTIISQYPSLLNFIAIEDVFQLLVGTTGIIFIITILQRRKVTVRFAAIYFTTILTYALLDSVLGYVLFGSNSLVLSAAFKGGGQIRAIIYSSVWLAYFTSSRRVKATFDGTRATSDRLVTSQAINDGAEAEPHAKFDTQLDTLESFAIKLDKGCREGKVADETVRKAENYLDEVSEEIIDSRSVGDRAYIVYEVRALLLWITHDEAESRELAKVASEIKGDDVLFTQTANMILRS